MSVIRMIKLFGWEPRIAAQLNEKRERELVSVKKNRLYDLANDLCKCVTVAVAHLASHLSAIQLLDSYHYHVGHILHIRESRDFAERYGLGADRCYVRAGYLHEGRVDGYVLPDVYLYPILNGF